MIFFVLISFAFADSLTEKRQCVVDCAYEQRFVSVNDYIIQGVNRELYPCKPDIFNKTYDKVVEQGETYFEYLKNCSMDKMVDAIYECVMANSWSFNKDGIKRWLKQPHREENEK